MKKIPLSMLAGCLFVVFVLPLLALQKPGAVPEPTWPDAKKYLKELNEAAKSAEKAGVLDDAIDYYGRLFFLNAKDESAKKKWNATQRKKSEALCGEALLARVSDRERSTALYLEAIRLDPKNDHAKKALKEAGLQLHEGQWRSAAKIDEYRQQDEARGKQRRSGIGLSDKFTIIRRDVFRLYTDVNVTDAQAVIEQMLNAIQSHYRAYCHIMGPFGLRYPDEGLDVVLFEKRKDYMDLTQAEGSAGVYIPSMQTCFFYKMGGYDFSTLLHEMTHQLNDRVLETSALAPWYEEGISEYFGAATFTRQGKEIELGMVNSARKAGFNGACRGTSGDGPIPFKDFLARRRAELTGVYYAQSWALTHYLMETHPLGRMILFDMITRCKAELREAKVAAAEEEDDAEGSEQKEDGSGEGDSGDEDQPDPPSAVDTEVRDFPGWIGPAKLERILKGYGYASIDAFETEFLNWHRTHL